jgi:hypothetical protein
MRYGKLEDGALRFEMPHARQGAGANETMAIAAE